MKQRHSVRSHDSGLWALLARVVKMGVARAQLSDGFHPVAGAAKLKAVVAPQA